MKKIRCEIITLQKARELAYVVAGKIRRSKYQPDIVVAVARGGFAPARFICDFLDLHSLASVQVRHYAAGAIRENQARIQYPVNANLRGLNVLLVDDVNDTGESLIAALKHILKRKPAEIRIAVLHEKKTTAVKADYYGHFIRNWRWIIYPWAWMEDLGAFLQKMKPHPKSVKSAAKRLSQEYAIHIPRKWLSRILQHTASAS